MVFSSNKIPWLQGRLNHCDSFLINKQGFFTIHTQAGTTIETV